MGNPAGAELAVTGKQRIFSKLPAGNQLSTIESSAGNTFQTTNIFKTGMRDQRKSRELMPQELASRPARTGVRRGAPEPGPLQSASEMQRASHLGQ